jgi:hypothetical protein
VRILITASVPSIRLIVPTPDVSAASAYDNSVEVTIARAPEKKKSMLGLFSSSASGAAGQTPYNTTRDFSDIVRRVGGEGGGGGDSVTGSEMRDRSSYDYDSIIDEERRDSMEDSLFEKTGHRSSMSSDSVFG